MRGTLIINDLIHEKPSNEDGVRREHWALRILFQWWESSGGDEILVAEYIASKISSVPILSICTTFNFRFATDKIEIDEVWTTQSSSAPILSVLNLK